MRNPRLMSLDAVWWDDGAVGYVDQRLLPHELRRERATTIDAVVEAIATLAGPVYGLAAAGVCYWLAHTTHEPFWYAAAYVGFFLNGLNLLPIPPFDGGGIAAAIDPRLWIAGVVAFLAYIVYFHAWTSPFSLLFLLVIAVVAVPRIRALFAGYIDPRFFAVSRTARIAIAGAYFATIAIAVGGAAVTYFDPRHT